MRRLTASILAALLVAACSSSGEIEGRLPDGREYRISVDPELQDQEPEGVSAFIIVDPAVFSTEVWECEDSCILVLGVTGFDRGGSRLPSYSNGVFTVSSGDWTMRIEVYQQIVDAWGNGIGEALVGGIRPMPADGGLPTFELSPPFRWANDTEIPNQMGVSYTSFDVRRDCGQLSVGCSPGGSVQVIPADQLYAPAPPWDDDIQVVVIDDLTNAP